MKEKLAEVLRLISLIETEEGPDCEEWEALDRIAAAVNKPRDFVSHCAPLPRSTPYYQLADKLANVLLGEKLPCDVWSLDHTLIIKKNEVIHMGVITCLAAYLIEDHGAMQPALTLIQNKIEGVYHQWLNS